MNNKHKKVRLFLIGSCIFLGVLPLIMWVACFKPTFSSASDNRIHAVVTIQPQKFLLDKIAGSNVSTSVLVPPNFNPETYSPTPQQLEELSSADVYFAMGVPCEETLLPKIKSISSSLDVVNTHNGITLRVMHEPHFHEDCNGHDHDHTHSVEDPHTWLSPMSAQVIAKNIADALISLDPEHTDLYNQNLRILLKELDSLNNEIASALRPYAGSKIIVYHPAFGYFTDAYQLEQISIEFGGKEPTAKYLDNIISTAKENNIHIIFVQPQFNQKSAEIISKAINGKVVMIDPLAEDYFKNLRHITYFIKSALEQAQ